MKILAVCRETRIVPGRQGVNACRRACRGRNHAAQYNAARTTKSTQKLRCVGYGAYSMSPPPTSVAKAKPAAVAAVAIELARCDLPAALNSTMAAVAGLVANPTPKPTKARPANT